MARLVVEASCVVEGRLPPFRQLQPFTCCSNCWRRGPPPVRRHLQLSWTVPENLNGSPSDVSYLVLMESEDGRRVEVQAGKNVGGPLPPPRHSADEGRRETNGVRVLVYDTVW